MEEERKGWICPNCKKVHSPDVQSCDCTKQEDQNPDQKSLLLE
jgi:hypothetical protein